MSDGLAEVVARVLLDEGGGPGSSLHSWRCEYPDRYGPCSCVDETANEAADAIRAAGWRKAPQEACTAICGDGGGGVGLLSAAMSIAYEHATAIDGEFGCCHNEDDFKADGRAPEYDGDYFDPIPDDCPGLKVLMRHLTALDAASNGCGDTTCDDEHGDEHDDMTTAATEETTHD